MNSNSDISCAENNPNLRNCISADLSNQNWLNGRHESISISFSHSHSLSPLPTGSHSFDLRIEVERLRGYRFEYDFKCLKELNRRTFINRIIAIFTASLLKSISIRTQVSNKINSCERRLATHSGIEIDTKKKHSKTKQDYAI